MSLQIKTILLYGQSCMSEWQLYHCSFWWLLTCLHSWRANEIHGGSLYRNQSESLVLNHLCFSQLCVQSGSTKKEHFMRYSFNQSRWLGFLDMVNKHTGGWTKKKSFSCERAHKRKQTDLGETGFKKRKAWELMLLVTPHSSAERVKRGKMSDRLLSWASPALHNSLHWGGNAQRLFQHHTKRKGN